MQVKFSLKFNGPLEASGPVDKESQLDLYKKLLASRPLDDKKIAEGLEILLWLLFKGFLNQKLFMKGCVEILGS